MARTGPKKRIRELGDAPEWALAEALVTDAPAEEVGALHAARPEEIEEGPLLSAEAFATGEPVAHADGGGAGSDRRYRRVSGATGIPERELRALVKERGYRDESGKLYVGKAFAPREWAAWTCVQGLGAAPYTGVGVHHTAIPDRTNFQGLGHIHNIFAYYANQLGWPRGRGPHLWLRSSREGGAVAGPKVYVGTHPAHDGIGISYRNHRFLHIEFIDRFDHYGMTRPDYWLYAFVLGVSCAIRGIPLKHCSGAGRDGASSPQDGYLFHRNAGTDRKTCPGSKVSEGPFARGMAEHGPKKDRGGSPEEPPGNPPGNPPDTEPDAYWGVFVEAGRAGLFSSRENAERRRRALEDAEAPNPTVKRVSSGEEGPPDTQPEPQPQPQPERPRDASVKRWAYPGDDAPKALVACWMADEARYRKLPPEAPVATALVESGMKNLSHGDKSSLGMFQQRPEWWGYPGDRAQRESHIRSVPYALCAFLSAMESHRHLYNEWDPKRGYTLPDPKVGEWCQRVQRSAYPNRYAERMREARGLIEEGRAIREKRAVKRGAVRALVQAPAAGMLTDVLGGVMPLLGVPEACARGISDPLTIAVVAGCVGLLRIFEGVYDHEKNKGEVASSP